MAGADSLKSSGPVWVIAGGPFSAFGWLTGRTKSEPVAWRGLLGGGGSGSALVWVSPVGFGHEGHDGDRVGGDVGAEVAVEGVDVGDQPFGFAAVGVGAEVDVAGRFEGAQAGVEAGPGLGW